jgi:ABC-type transport system substrate-binding protein
MSKQDEFLDRVFDDPATRRDFLSRALKAGGVLAVLGAGGGDLATNALAKQSAATPRFGGVLNMSSSQDVAKLGTAYWGGSGWATGYAMFNTLVGLTPDGKSIVPELARTISTNKSGTVYTFTLRPNVKFSDGTPMTAADVKYTLERQIDPNGPGQAGSMYGTLGITGTKDFTSGKTPDIAGLKVVNPGVFQIQLDQPNSSILYTLAMSMAGIVPMAYTQKVGTQQFETQPIGTGPYKLQSFSPGQSFSLTRNTVYWDQANRGYLDSINWALNVDPNLAALRILKGQQDLMMDPLSTGTLNSVRNNPTNKKDLRRGAVNNVFFITNSLLNPYTSKLAVRQAIAYAIDRNKVVRGLGGVAQAANGGLFSPLSPYYQPGLNFPYDPERAKALLKKAGLAKGFKITNYSQNHDPQKTIGENVQADLAKIGIRVDTKEYPSTVWAPIVTKNPPAMVTGQWELPYPHGSYLMDSAFTAAALKAGCCNFSTYTSSKFQQLYQAADATTSKSRLISLYKAMDRLAVRDQALWIPIIYPVYATVISSNLKGYTVPGTPSGDALFLKRYWLAS